MEFRTVDPDQLARSLDPASDRLVLVYLWGPDCPNCEVFARAKPSLLAELDAMPGHESLDLLAIDVYAHPKVGTELGVFGIPTFMFFRRGKRIGRMSEFRGKDFWLAVVREQLAARS